MGSGRCREDARDRRQTWVAPPRGRRPATAADDHEGSGHPSLASRPAAIRGAADRDVIAYTAGPEARHSGPARHAAREAIRAAAWRAIPLACRTQGGPDEGPGHKAPGSLAASAGV